MDERKTILMLAAGRGERFGSDKRIARLPNGSTLLMQSLHNALASGLPVLVCLRPEETSLRKAIAATGACVLVCNEAHRGMGSTLAEAVAQCGAFDGVLVALADMPHILPSSFQQVSRNLTPHNICQPHWQGAAGHPVGFGRDYFPALRQLSGERGARALVMQHRAALVTVALNDPGILQDVDRPTDLEGL